MNTSKIHNAKRAIGLLLAATTTAVAVGTVPSAASAGSEPIDVGGEEAVALIAATPKSRAAGSTGELAEISRQLLLDSSLRYMPAADRLVYREPIAPSLGSPDSAPPYATSRTFGLHSKPGANQVIYLDFNGHTTSGTDWNYYTDGAPISSPAFDNDGTPGRFTMKEHAIMQRVWQRVREDFAPFDVDVTTEAPPVSNLLKSGPSDDRFGARVVITPTDWNNCGCGGFAFLDSFTDAVDTPTFVFNTSSSKAIGEAVSHEVGHMLGLYHDGVDHPTDDSRDQEYFAGHGDWAPIMGVGYYRSITQWSRGDYRHASTTQNDIGIIASTLGYRNDDHSDSTSSTTPLPAGRTKYGTVGSSVDRDTFHFSLSGTTRLTIAASPQNVPDPQTNLRLVLRNRYGKRIASAVPAGRLDASMTVRLVPGRYYVEVSGMGEGDPVSNGYGAYGSLGFYRVLLQFG